MFIPMETLVLELSGMPCLLTLPNRRSMPTKKLKPFGWILTIQPIEAPNILCHESVGSGVERNTGNGGASFIALCRAAHDELQSVELLERTVLRSEFHLHWRNYCRLGKLKELKNYPLTS